jgi:hypothetical protein
MAEYSTILFEVRDKVAHLTINRPEAANSLNATLSAEMMDAVVHCEEDADIRAIVVSGTGRFFCAGADLKGFYSAGSELKSRVSVSRNHLAPCACGSPGNRRGERRGSGCRNGTRMRVRPGYRRGLGALHDGVHEDRTEPGRHDDLFPSAANRNRPSYGASSAQSHAISQGGTGLGNRESSRCRREPCRGGALHCSSTRGRAYESLRSSEAADALRIYRKPRNSD